MLSIIVAMAQNRAIGRDNQLLWHISADLRRFKAITTGHAVIMGRRTFQSIGRPLPNRHNIVVSRNPSLVAEGCTVVHSLTAALALCPPADEAFVIGGGQIYAQALPLAQRMYITLVHSDMEADTFFPEFDPAQWRTVAQRSGGEVDGLSFSFIDMERV